MKISKKLLSLVGFIGLALGVCTIVNPIKAHRLSGANPDAKTVVFLGATEVNKHGIIDKMLSHNNPSFNYYRDSDMVKMTICGQEFYLENTPGQERYRNLIPASCRDVDIAVLCYKTDDEDTKKDIGYFYDVVNNYCQKNVKYIVVGEMGDSSHEQKYSIDYYEEADELTKKFNLSANPYYILVDAVSDTGIYELEELLFEKSNEINSEIKSDSYNESMSSIINIGENSPKSKSCC